MYYDMSGFDYGILDVVQVLHLRKRRGNYYDCRIGKKQGWMPTYVPAL